MVINLHKRFIKSDKNLKRDIPDLEDRALELGFHLQPSWSSGPNTTKNPLREALGVDWSQRDRKFTIFQTLPVDATAVWTLVGHVVADGFHF